MSKQEFTFKATATIQAFLDTCFEMGLTAEKTKQLICSKEGIEVMNSVIS
jgi:hypothetical protein